MLSDRQFGTPQRYRDEWNDLDREPDIDGPDIYEENRGEPERTPHGPTQHIDYDPEKHPF